MRNARRFVSIYKNLKNYIVVRMPLKVRDLLDSLTVVTVK
jgi:hypothetical protein